MTGDQWVSEFEKEWNTLEKPWMSLVEYADSLCGFSKAMDDLTPEVPTHEYIPIIGWEPRYKLEDAPPPRDLANKYNNILTKASRDGQIFVRKELHATATLEWSTPIEWVNIEGRYAVVKPKEE